jgi:hypothetical protein
LDIMDGTTLVSADVSQTCGKQAVVEPNETF